MSVPAVRILAAIRDARLRVFTLADVLALCPLTASAAAHALSRLVRHGLIVRIVRGVYGSRLGPEVHPFEAVPHVTAPWPAYVSLHSALSIHGVIDQVPSATYVVTPGRPRRLRTRLGEFRVHHVRQGHFWGFQWQETAAARYPLAEPEKAIVDCLHLEARGGRGIALFPELHLRGNVSLRRLREYIERTGNGRVTALAERRRLLPPPRSTKHAMGSRSRSGSARA